MTACVLYLAWVLAEPPLGDAHRLPPLAYLAEGRRFNCRYRSYLERRIEFEPDRLGVLMAAKAETDWLYRVWDSAEGAHPDYQCSPEMKREYLRTLRLMIGRDAYNRTELPPCVPLHRFNELR